MRALLLLALLASSMASVVVSAANAQDGCSRLWVARNSIYKAYGYCFKTPRAIAYFGNAGCRYNYEADVPLSRYDRARVARLQAQERYLGCR